MGQGSQPLKTIFRDYYWVTNRFFWNRRNTYSRSGCNPRLPEVYSIPKRERELHVILATVRFLWGVAGGSGGVNSWNREEFRLHCKPLKAKIFHWIQRVGPLTPPDCYSSIFVCLLCANGLTSAFGRAKLFVSRDGMKRRFLDLNAWEEIVLEPKSC